MFKDFCCIPC